MKLKRLLDVHLMLWRNKKRYYSYEEIVELEKKANEKYHSLYEKKSLKGKSVDAAKIRLLYSKYIQLYYLKAIMEVMDCKNIGKVDVNTDIDQLSLKVLEATDPLEYKKHMESLSNKNKR